MVKDRFDFEQDICECWHIIDDLKQLHSMVCENEDTSKDDIANVLGGMFTLYDDRFRQLMVSFENLIKVGDSLIQPKDNPSRYDQLCKDKNFYEKRYSELLTKLRIISETDEIVSTGVQKLLDESVI